MDEFVDFLGGLVPNYDRLLLLGDFNIQACCPLNSFLKDFSTLVDSFGFDQLVKGPTHSSYVRSRAVAQCIYS